MPRRKNKNKNKKRNRGRGRSGTPQRGNNESGASVVRQTFSYHIRFVGSATIAGADMTPFSNTLFGPDVQNMLDLYQEYRMVGLRITMMPAKSLSTSSGNSDTGIAVGWRPMASGSTPTTVDHVIQSTKYAYINDSMTVPVTFTIRGDEFRRHMLTKWLHVITTGAPELRDHGQLWYIDVGTNAGTIVWTWVVESTWEFQSPVPIGQFLSKHYGVTASESGALKPAPGSKKADEDEKSDSVVLA